MSMGERKRLLIYLGVAAGLLVLYLGANGQPSGHSQQSGQWSSYSPYAGGVGGDGRCVYAGSWSNC
jgi:hypothetical protein